MKPRFLLPFLLALLTIPAGGQRPDPETLPDRNKDPLEVKLPNGKSQRDEILKADHARNIEESKHLAKLAQELSDELEKTDKFVLSVASLKKTEEIEKLAKRIRGRLKRF